MSNGSGLRLRCSAGKRNGKESNLNLCAVFGAMIRWVMYGLTFQSQVPAKVMRRMHARSRLCSQGWNKLRKRSSMQLDIQIEHFKMGKSLLILSSKIARWTDEGWKIFSRTDPLTTPLTWLLTETSSEGQSTTPPLCKCYMSGVVGIANPLSSPGLNHVQILSWLVY